MGRSTLIITGEPPVEPAGPGCPEFLEHSLPICEGTHDKVPFLSHRAELPFNIGFAWIEPCVALTPSWLGWPWES